jgi:plastocyanin domain-containing protein
MEFDKIFVALFTIAGMVFTYWFFLMKKEEVVSVTDSVDIIVEGGYSPNIISIPVNKVTRISFTRKDPSSCLEEVVLSDFRIKKYLPHNKKVTVAVMPKKKGEFGFACGMNMFHGKIIVE